MKYLYYVYDLKDNELLVFVGDSQEVCKYLNVTKGSLYSGVCRNTKFNDRYHLEKEHIKGDEVL